MVDLYILSNFLIACGREGAGFCFMLKNQVFLNQSCLTSQIFISQRCSVKNLLATSLGHGSLEIPSQLSKSCSHF